MTKLHQLEMPLPTWEDAACHGLDTELFFSDDEETQDAALRVCATCPAKHECLQWALTYKEMHGVWGGTTPEQRKITIAKRTRVFCPGCGSRAVKTDALRDRLEICVNCGLSWEI